MKIYSKNGAGFAAPHVSKSFYIFNYCVFQLVYIAIKYLKCLKGPPTTISHYSKSHHGLMMSSSQKKYIVKAIFIYPNKWYSYF